MDKYDTSQLTEFPRFEPESTQSGVSTFFNKLLKFPIFSPSEASEVPQDKNAADNRDLTASAEQIKHEYDDNKAETGSYALELEGRSLPNVLRRITSLVALGSGNGTRYADTELARYWMPDDISRECYECATRFSALRRRHHCRVCGQIFCSRCCSQRVPGHIFGCAGGLRVCNYCCNVVLSYLKENDLTGDISPDLRTLQENLQMKFPEHKGQQLNKTREHFMFSHEQEERTEPRTTQKESLHDIFRQLSFTLPTQQHRYRLVRYNGVWRGCDIMQWIMDNTSNKTRAQATSVCQALLSAGYVQGATPDPHFADYALYRPLAELPTLAHDQPPAEECTRIVESVSSYCLDLNLDDSSARLIKTNKAEQRAPSSSEDETPAVEHNEEYNESSNVCRAIWCSGEEHLRLLLRQCAARRGLSAAWLHVLLPLCQRAADLINLDVHATDIDVRNYVQVKKVPGGTIQDSCVIHGVVMTKNVALRGMPRQMSNPSILLLDCSIAYQRVEGKLTTLEPVLLQESEYLSRCAARVVALGAGVVLSRGSVSRGVQEALRAAGLAVAGSLRPSALRRAARAARADVLASIDARIGTPRLGTCHNFYVKNYSGKTLMVLEGCAEPNLGCCILLRGASVQELIRVKKVVKFMLLACYNWKLERAFLGDIEAVLPEPGMTFDDDKDNVEGHAGAGEDRESKGQSEADIFDLNNMNKVMESVSHLKADVRTNGDLADDEALNGSPNSDSNNDDLFSCTNKTSSDHKPTAGDARPPVDDPLQQPRQARKADSDKNPSCGVPIRDFSDPLRATLSADDDVFLPREEQLKADSHTDRWSTDDVVLSMSPNMVIPAPYEETEAGRRSKVRMYFPPPPRACRPSRAPATPRPAHRDVAAAPLTPVVKEAHPFIREAIRSTVDDPAVRRSLAHYRATGGRLASNGHHSSCPLHRPSVVKEPPREPEPDGKQAEDDAHDPFAPENHQRLSLLLYSYSNKSANVPDFCVNPWIVTMEMYGRHDISLGAFLDKYCFNGDYKCTSNTCQVPMNQHVRRFVHGDVCITITCNTIGHSNVDKARPQHAKQVMFWSRCERCGCAGAARRLSARAACVSLAGYVRARSLCPRYVRARTCPHPLHAHAHAFVSNLTTAYFRFSKITAYDIQLPPEEISINYDVKQMREDLITQLNELMLKGHETFSSISDPEADKEFQAFKQHTDQIHLALTSSSIHETDSLRDAVRRLWSVSDSIIFGEKMLRDAQDKWSTPGKNTKPVQETAVEDKSDVEDSSGDNDNSSRELDKEHGGGDEDEERGDKKTARQILSQLLSNNQPASHSGVVVNGVLPVVLAGALGPLLAAALASAAYRRARQRHGAPSEPEETESVARDKSDGQKSKEKSVEHIEVVLKEGLTCRVYFARQFEQLRHAVLAPPPAAPAAPAPPRAAPCACDDKNVCDIEESFIRSVAQCVPWAARGGKSGSTFCKTKDDRFVLKEMTKPESQQFLDFAPHYFSYVAACREERQPSLLARIVGVFSACGADVLVLEHVWYGCGPGAPRYDLKGSSRHRLAPQPARPPPQHVLMDENLLNSRWERPLYVQSASGAALWRAVRRDTALLARLGVMDYSLLLAVQDDTLLLGIIDYIRTFTWDKKLEHLVKKNLGSGQPTVVSPDQYRSRFCAAARKYFLHVPQHWDVIRTQNTDT
ncbi:putative 1-phosphatidylinositol 3-phosphate 5-kinase isoform X2 [Bombyx mandarina]|uniref:1-phosphatidylinositol-3-phosphate 5-kinase n=1 Tax=Bombyx mandarina TaxID=7092 RepID=A0A6J2JHN3_BOMMA|nr:putative 1-phosphatidylinositol 3-phosphate 5-kinase isoform X2 [Bombyx mandarina]